MPEGSAQMSGADKLLYEAYRRGWIDDRTYQRARKGAQNVTAAVQQWAAPVGQAVMRSNPALAPQAALLEAVRLGMAGPRQKTQTRTGGAPPSSRVR